MILDRWVDDNEPNKSLFEDILIKGNTNNEFQFFNLDDLYDANKMFDYYQKYIEKLVKALSSDNNVYNKKGKRKLIFTYKQSDRFNAGCWETANEDRVELNEGAVLKIYELCYRLCVYKEILDFAEKEEPISFVNGQIVWSLKHKKLCVTMPLSDSVRKNIMAEYMAMLAIKFLICHEVGHVYSGHTRYYLQVMDEIEEIKAKRNDKEKSLLSEREKQLYLDLQTMEMDADAFAANRILEEVVRLLDEEDKIIHIIPHRRDLFLLLQYAIHAVFFIMRNEYGINDFDEYEIKEHPAIHVRESFVFSTLDRCYNMQDKKRNGYVLPYCNFEDIEIGLIDNTISNTMGRSNEEYIKYIDNNAEEMSEYAGRLQSNWERVARKIKPESRLPLEGIDF